MLILISSCALHAQENSLNGNVGKDQGKVAASFLTADIILKSSEIVSNVLRVANNTKEKVRFTVDITYPEKWKLLGKKNEVYEIGSFDSVFIPVRLIPGLLKGNTHYIFNAFLISEENEQIANTFFYAHTKKLVKWSVSAGPSEKIYFMNNEKSAPFSLSVSNEGNEQQDILLTMLDNGKNVIVSDTNNKIIDNRYHNLVLNPSKDTTLNFKLSYFEGLRNQKRVDVDMISTRSADEEKKYTLFVQTRESRQVSKSIFKKNKKIDFIRLSNKKKVNPYGTSVLPLIVETNIYNLVSGQPIMNLSLNGRAMLANKADLVYSTQTSFNSYFLKKGSYFSNAFNLGYFHPRKGSLQIGNVGGGGIGNGISSGGRGVSGSFNPDRHHTVGAFITGDNNSFTFQNRVAYGLSHHVRIASGVSIFSQVGRTLNKFTDITIDYWNVKTNLPFKNHHFTTGVTGTNTNYSDTLKRKGNAYTLNYGGNFLKKRLRANINANYYSKYLTPRNNSRLFIYSHASYNLNKKWSILLSENYSSLESTYYINKSPFQRFNTFLSNQIKFSRTLSAGSLSPGIFYNINDIAGVKANAKGVSIDYNFQEPVSGLRFNTSLKGAYNQFESFTGIPQYFTFQFNNFLQYKTITAHALYVYGPMSPDTNIFMTGVNYPQNVFFAVQHQYQFSNKRFVLQTNASYSYLNRYYNNSFGIFPELNYCTYSGWRFKFSLNYNITSSNYMKAANYSNPNPIGENDLAPKVNKSYNIGIGIRKEFGIPFPKFLSKYRFTDIEFIAFLDINGNRKMDKDELPLENIVIKMGEYELLSNERGRAYLENVKSATYPLMTFSLVDLGGWFSILEDSMVVADQKIQYIPFVRGVKIYGNIILDREKYAKEMEVKIDLSKIRITATDSLGKSYSTLSWDGGQYQFYVPYGTYVLTMEETILDGNFSLAQNNIKLKLGDGVGSMYNSFYIIEKRRKIKTKKFDSKGNEIKEKEHK